MYYWEKWVPYRDHIVSMSTQGVILQEYVHWSPNWSLCNLYCIPFKFFHTLLECPISGVYMQTWVWLEASINNRMLLVFRRMHVLCHFWKFSADLSAGNPHYLLNRTKLILHPVEWRETTRPFYSDDAISNFHNQWVESYVGGKEEWR